MARYFKERGVTLRFIEFMDAGNHNDWKLEKVVSAAEILRRLGEELDFEPVDLSSEQQVAKSYRYKDGSAEFGLINSVSQPFCGGCTRARISADGKLYTCLFASQGLDLKKILRAPDYDRSQLSSILSQHWYGREDRYSELRRQLEPTRDRVEMSYIGG